MLLTSTGIMRRRRGRLVMMAGHVVGAMDSRRPPVVEAKGAANETDAETHGVYCVPLAPFGAVCSARIRAAVAEGPDGATMRAIHAALRQHTLLVFKGQDALRPAELAAFTHSFDPKAPSVWRDLNYNPWEKEKVEAGARDKMLPEEPAVRGGLPPFVVKTPDFSGTLAIGQGELRDHFGLNGHLGRPASDYANNESNSQVVGGGVLQWHIDGCFYGKHPPAVTALRCVEPPPPRDLKYHYDNHGTALHYRAGSTAYVSAFTAFELLSPEQQQWAETTTVHYGQHPFKATLGIVHAHARLPWWIVQFRHGIIY